MKRTLRAGISLILALIAALPVSAQVSAKPQNPMPAAKGELVTVTLRDGQSIAGTIGDLVEDIGFQVIPRNEPLYFVRNDHVSRIRSAVDGSIRRLPQRHRMSTSKKVWIGIAIGVGAPMAIFLITCAATKGHCSN